MIFQSKSPVQEFCPGFILYSIIMTLSSHCNHNHTQNHQQKLHFYITTNIWPNFAGTNNFLTMILKEGRIAVKYCLCMRDSIQFADPQTQQPVWIHDQWAAWTQTMLSCENSKRLRHTFPLKNEGDQAFKTYEIFWTDREI